MNKIQILVFSPTGNTKYLANRLSSLLNCEVIYEVDKVNTEHLVIMSSIHAFRVPSFLSNAVKNAEKVSVIAVGCNDAKINSAAGIKILKKVRSTNKEIGVYTVLPMPLTIFKKFDKEYGLKIIQNSLKAIEEISKFILENRNYQIKISYISRALGIVHFVEKHMVKLFGLELYANENCIKCGKCVNGCPRNNIKINNKPKFSMRCMMCMKCIYGCPVNAINPRISKFLVFKDGYSLEEYLKCQDETKFLD